MSAAIAKTEIAAYTTEELERNPTTISTNSEEDTNVFASVFSTFNSARHFEQVSSLANNGRRDCAPQAGHVIFT
jgi:hypothetical protein